MVRRPLGAVLAGALLALGVSGCTGRVDVAPASPHPTATHEQLPPVADQVARARRMGPGWLNYCPARPGRAPAQYDLIAPGGGTVPGWCRSSIARRSLGDYVTFAAHWDASTFHGGRGTATFVYLVPRGESALATPVPLLVSQSGVLPP